MSFGQSECGNNRGYWIKYNKLFQAIRRLNGELRADCGAIDVLGCGEWPIIDTRT